MEGMTAFLIVFATVWAMEAVAWTSHKYIMHGFGWAWHRDHHEPHDGFFERNDLYAVFGAAISISGFMFGSPVISGAYSWEPAWWIGVGVLIYGIIYTLLHDGLIHQRWFKYVPRKGYAKRLVQGAQAAPRDDRERRRGELRLHSRDGPGVAEAGAKKAARSRDRRGARGGGLSSR